MVFDIICFIGLLGVVGLAFLPEELSRQQKFRSNPFNFYFHNYF